MHRFWLTASVLALTSAASAQEIVELEGVTIIATAAPIEVERSGSSVEVLDAEDLTDGTELLLADRLNRLPGVSFSQAGPQGSTANLTIRGARSRYIPVYIDGILVTDPSGTNVYFDDFGGLGLGNIERVEVLRGSQSALYGGSAVGGVIDISTLPANAPEGTSGNMGLSFGSFGSMSASARVTERHGPLTLSLGLSRDRSDGFSAASENDLNLSTAAPNDKNDEADGFRRDRLTFGARYEVNSDLTIGVNGFAEQGETEFDEFFSDDQDNNGFPTYDYGDDVFAYTDGTPDEISERRALGLRAFAEFTTGAWDHVADITSYTIDRDLSSPTVGSPDGTPFASSFDAQRIAFSYKATSQVTSDWRLSFGLNVQNEKVEATSLPGGSADITTKGLFAEALWSPSDQLDVTGTLRYDDHSEFGGQATGRLAFAWRPTETTTLRGAVATGYRPPSIDELYGDYGFFVGNAALDPEHSRSYELGVDHSFGNGASISATAFRLDVDNLVVYQPGTPPLYIGTLTNASGTTRREGLELSFDAPVTDRLNVFGNATLLTTEDGSGGRLTRVPGREFALGFDAQLTDRLDLGVIARHVTDRPQDNTAAFTLVDMDPYTVVDLKVGYDISDTTRAFVSVHNLLDEDYELVPGYGTSPRAITFGINASF